MCLCFYVVKMLSSEQNVQECDARDDAMKNYSWYQKYIYYISLAILIKPDWYQLSFPDSKVYPEFFFYQ
jgi:hypothetical protein